MGSGKAVLETGYEFESIDKTAVVGACKRMDALKTPALIQAILTVGADDTEPSECVEIIHEWETTRRQAVEAQLDSISRKSSV